MRNALGQLLLAVFLLGGCEDNKLVTPPPAEPPSQAKPSQANPTQPSPTPEATPPAPHMHGATGVGDTAPAPERAPAKTSNDSSPSGWTQKADAGTASDAGAGRQGLPTGEAKGPPHP